MKMIIMQCDCGENLTLATNTERRQIMGWCLKCGKQYDIKSPVIEPVEIAEMIQAAHKIADQVKKATDPEGILFYLRCTKLQLTT